MKMNLLKALVFLFFLLTVPLIAYGQTEKQLCGSFQKENQRHATPIKADLMDQFGNYYSFD